jgi:hypothetical protein
MWTVGYKCACATVCATDYTLMGLRPAASWHNRDRIRVTSGWNPRQPRRNGGARPSYETAVD